MGYHYLDLNMCCSVSISFKNTLEFFEVMEKIKKGDFVKIDFTGRVKGEGYIFDTTSKEVAQKNGIYNPQATYGPVTVCVGQNMVLKGLDESLEGKELGFEDKVEISPEGAFGKKDPKLLKLIPTNKFKSNNVSPRPGLQVDVDGTIGFVKTVTGGRTIVDFNHPLSGKDLVYDVKVLNKVDDKKEQIGAMLTMKLNMKPDNYQIEVSDDGSKATINFKGLPEIPEEMSQKLKEMITGSVDVKEITFKGDNKGTGSEASTE